MRPLGVLFTLAVLLAVSASFAGPAIEPVRAPSGGPESAGPDAAAVEPPAIPLSYVIDARYDPEAGVIEGSERVSWTNTTSTPTGELRLHLYLNAFRDARSTWMRERRRKAGRRHPDWGGIELTRVLGTGGEDWQSRISFVSPDDGNPDDATVARIELPAPVGPGESVTVDLAFRSTMPGIWARTGRAGDYIAGAQWYPSVGVFEGDPAEWNCPQFHAFTEFYADFGNYRVTLTLPERYRGKVGATGSLEQESGAEEGWFSATFRAERVHDFAWFADPRFVVRERRFAAAAERDAAEERRWLELLGEETDADEMRLSDVDVKLFLQPAHLHLEERHFAAVFAGLRWFGRAFGAYPYPSLSVIDPPRAGRRSSGMEYPQLFTAGSRILSPEGHHSPEGVVLHEFGHQYFQGQLASDELQHSFLDEGFTVFASDTARVASLGESRALTSFGPVPFRGRPLVKPELPSGAVGALLGVGEGSTLGLVPGRLLRYFVALPSLSYYPARRDFPWTRRADWLTVYGADRVDRPGWTFSSFNDYRMHVYRLTSITLESYRRAAGDRLFYRAMRRYVREQRWRHPRPDDFIAAAEGVWKDARAAGRLAPSSLASRLEPARYFEQVWRTPGWVDHFVGGVDCAPLPERARRGDGSPGDDDDGSEAATDPGQTKEGDPEEGAGEATAVAKPASTATQAPSAKANAAEGGHAPRRAGSACRLTLRRRGPWRLPVEVEVGFGDGSVERVLWDGDEASRSLEFRGPRIDSVRIDPQRVWLLDVDLSNNSWRREPRREERWRLLLSTWQQVLTRIVSIGRLG